jgi:hypothetical protein
MSKATAWVIGKEDRNWESPSGKSTKVRLEPRPKGWAHLPRRFVVRRRDVTREIGATYLHVLYEVAVEWLDLACIPHNIRYPTVDVAEDQYHLWTSTRMSGNPNIFSPEDCVVETLEPEPPKPTKQLELVPLPDRKKDAPW